MASQVTNGKAFEWAVGKEVQSYGFTIISDNAAIANEACFNKVSNSQQLNYQQSAAHAVEHIFNKESLFNANGSVQFLPDVRGQSGDVRDIVISTVDKIVGISCKTNHDAFKHSRLSKKNNFVEKWGLHSEGCSDHYFEEIAPVFDELKQIRSSSNRQAKWKEQNNVPKNFYWPILDAFEKEILRIESTQMCQQFIQYIVGNKDFYKVVSRNKTVHIQGFNLNGTLNVTQPKLPTKIDLIKNKNSQQYSKTIIFDKGWTFNFRIHNASSRVEASLKFDVTAISLSPNLYTHHIDYTSPINKALPGLGKALF